MSRQEKHISFEEALEELERIAEKLERGQLTLEESIKAYERGMELKKICSERLKEAEGKIEMLSKNPEGKTVKETSGTAKEKNKAKEEILF
ncbi:MAG TPA: exodeoxyribonuclease VII small subunit [Leptospiraceae bacterium]|nr:exodeoxyribonuclease VII small subunit [Leptospiraceae bacterium]HMY67380.1 exodeoxyribonuclease VII small subunit [Leptospiraceae bacterium]HMZ60270.1 exodeoxyribonuclease VII small subunit [Leptospiraceae bacterium]HNF12531.1 exodeoxyribonuclease VII small subunit [Leptospiraceae bacterium]HNF26291.1 exodeoxyribonuclease VII small subunit [Leptospiraceae bacterium]